MSPLIDGLYGDPGDRRQGAGLCRAHDRPSVPGMSGENSIYFCLEPGLRQSVAGGGHNFFARIEAVCRGAGMAVHVLSNSPGDKARAARDGAWSLMHMEPPLGARSVTVRRAYYYPFWSIEGTEKRWEFQSAKARFDACDVPAKEAARFAGYWRKRLFSDMGDVGRDGFVYVPLQGRLTARRSFQSTSPIEMVEAVLEHDPGRRVVATLHPSEIYDEEEIAALERLENRHGRLTVMMGGIGQLLPRCDYVVTENSSVGFAGLFLGKPLVLFARIDFHHVALKVAELGVAEAIGRAPETDRDFDDYLWWFLQHMAINAGRPEAEDRIAARLRALGWPV